MKELHVDVVEEVRSIVGLSLFGEREKSGNGFIEVALISSCVSKSYLRSLRFHFVEGKG